jgi:predicted permease
VSIRVLFHRLIGIVRKRKLNQDLDEEIQSHLDMQIEDNIRRGMTLEEATYAARRSFGGVEQIKETYRDRRGLPIIETTVQDLRFAIRVLRRTPVYTVVLVLTLAIGIGANTAIFSLVDAVLIKMLPVKNPDQLFAIDTYNLRGERNNFSYPLFQQLRDNTHTFNGVFAAIDGSSNMEIVGPGSGQSLKAEVQLVSGEYFQVLGVNALTGRTLTVEDNQIPGAHPVAVISYDFWRNKLGADASIVGKGIKLKNQPFTIIGVSPPEFFGESVGRAPDVWVPLMMQPQFDRGESFLDMPNMGWLRVMARLDPSISKQQAQAALTVWLNQVQSDQTELGRNARRLRNAEIIPGSKGISETRDKFSRQLWILTAVVGVLLLIACANVANLLLVRTTARAKEVAVRLAIGAGRWRLIRQFLTESLVLAFAGAGLGLIFASWGSRFLLVMASEGAGPIPINVSLNLRILGFTMLLALLTSVLFGLTPALSATRQDIGATLKENLVARPQLRLSRLLVIFQVALSLLLITGAGLFVQTLRNLRTRSMGFDADKVLQVRIDPHSAGYKDEQLPELYERVLNGVRSVPGVVSASTSDSGFRTGDSRTCCIALEGYTFSATEDRQIRTSSVAPGYFQTMGLPILLGRDFQSQDLNSPNKSGERTTSRKVAIINASMAHRFFGDANPIGKRFGWGDPPDVKYDLEIIGVATNAIYGNLREETSPLIYLPGSRGQLLVVRAAGTPESVASSISNEIKAVDKNLLISGIKTVPQLVDQSLTLERLLAKLSSFFGLLALVLAAVGLYGVMAYSVVRRTKEIGIRLALGAQPSSVRRMVVRETLVLVLIGVLIGVPTALAVTRLISSLLYAVKPTDPITISLGVLVIVVSALLAGFLPARTASRVDPLIALRYE